MSQQEEEPRWKEVTFDEPRMSTAPHLEAVRVTRSIDRDFTRPRPTAYLMLPPGDGEEGPYAETSVGVPLDALLFSLELNFYPPTPRAPTDEEASQLLRTIAHIQTYTTSQQKEEPKGEESPTKEQMMANYDGRSSYLESRGIDTSQLHLPRITACSDTQQQSQPPHHEQPPG